MPAKLQTNFNFYAQFGDSVYKDFHFLANLLSLRATATSAVSY